MTNKFEQHLDTQLDEIKQAGLYKSERIISSPQQTQLTLEDNSQLINLCANNYLGMANQQELIDAAKQGVDKFGFGMASVRFICGTQTIHRQLEQDLSQFLSMADTVLYAACYDANCGLFETLFDAQDAIISDSLNHASVIDGIRLCKAKRLRYKNNDMADLEAQLQQTSVSRFRVIATDGVFSMDGSIAQLQKICQLAEKYDALVMVDDSHAVGVLGENGSGSHEYCDVLGKIDFLTGTLGKALGGGSGGYIACKSQAAADMLRQRSRTYLFSNSLSPIIVYSSIKALKLLKNQPETRQKLQHNSHYFREKMAQAGFNLLGADHPIVPVLIGDAKQAGIMAKELLNHGIYVIAFSYPVVPHDQARIRTQISAAHTQQQLDQAITAFTAVGKEMGII